MLINVKFNVLKYTFLNNEIFGILLTVLLITLIKLSYATRQLRSFMILKTEFSVLHFLKLSVEYMFIFYFHEYVTKILLN